MIACVTSVGEETTDLCVWALERNGFEVILFQDKSSLGDKLESIYDEMQDDFIRVDADVIVNRDCNPENILTIAQKEHLQHAWWLQFMTFCWYSQWPIYGGVQFIKKEALPELRDKVKRYKDMDRCETQLSRIVEFYNPRRFESVKEILGVHGYGIKDIKPVIKLKANRGQSANYDWDLVRRMNEL